MYSHLLRKCGSVPGDTVELFMLNVLSLPIKKQGTFSVPGSGAWWMESRPPPTPVSVAAC